MISKFSVFDLPPLQELGESCFKSPKVPLDEYFTTEMVCKVCAKSRLCSITVSEGGRDTG